jgi:DNA-binding MarR family transcriptional regulator
MTRPSAASLIFLTERGWEEVRAALRIIASIEHEWTQRLGPRNIEQLRRLLTELGATADAAPKQP